MAGAMSELETGRMIADVHDLLMMLKLFVANIEDTVPDVLPRRFYVLEQEARKLIERVDPGYFSRGVPFDQL